MADPAVKILFIDDDEDDFILARDLLDDISGVTFAVDWVQDYGEAVTALAADAEKSPGRAGYDACLVDFRLGEKDGITLIREARGRGCTLPIILLTGQGDHAIDLAAMNAGAADFLHKSQLTAGLLERALRYAIHSSHIESQRARLLAIAEQQAAQLRSLAAELTQAEQRERRRVAQTLHDHLQQLLVAAKMRVDRLCARPPDDKTHKAATQVRELLEGSIAASRSLTVQLSPPVLHDRGLVPALQWLGGQFDKEHDLPVEVVAQASAGPVHVHIKEFLFQAVRELLFNVVKHAQARRAVVTVGRTAADEFEVTVHDDGKGCDPCRIARRSADDGFGLSHLQQRLEFLGGGFTFSSDPGEGCKVTITMPMAAVAAPPADAQAPRGQSVEGASRPADSVAPDAAAASRDDASPADPGAVRVMLVDDHGIVREGLTGLLHEHRGIAVVGQAADGQAAVDLCRRIHPDVVVMDISMPGMSGIEATRAITDECPGVRVIGLSMHEPGEVADAMRDAGAAACLPKGAASEGLIAAIMQDPAPAVTTAAR